MSAKFVLELLILSNSYEAFQSLIVEFNKFCISPALFALFKNIHNFYTKLSSIMPNVFLSYYPEVTSAPVDIVDEVYSPRRTN